MHATDNELVENVRQRQCSESLSELHNRHGGLVNGTLVKYAGAAAQSHCSGVSREDFKEDALSIVYNAAMKFNPAKNSKFSTWLGNTARYHCLNTIKKQQKYVDGTDYLKDYSDRATNDDEIAADKMRGEADYVLRLLESFHDSRVAYIFKTRYFSKEAKNVSFAVIAERLNMSTQGVIDIHNEARDFIRQKRLSTENMDRI